MLHHTSAIPVVCRSAKTFGVKLAYSANGKQHSSAVAAQELQQNGSPSNGSNREPDAATNGHRNGYALAAHAAEAQSAAGGAAELQEAGEQAAQEPAVRYFVMGCR